MKLPIHGKELETESGTKKEKLEQKLKDIFFFFEIDKKVLNQEVFFSKKWPFLVARKNYCSE